MDLSRYLDDVHRQLAVTAEAGGEEARVVADRLIAAVTPAFRLALLDALGDATSEITMELAPGSVELRLRGRDPEFVVTVPPPDPSSDPTDGPEGEGLAERRAGDPASAPPPGAAGGEPSESDIDDDEVARVNLRLPKQLKVRIEAASAREGLSLNSWLVRAASAAERDRSAPPGGRRAARGSQRYTGWVR